MALSFSAAVTRLEALLAISGFTVWAGEPAIPAKKVAAWWYTGPSENALIPETLSDHPYSERITCRFYWSVGQRGKDPSRALELEVQSVTRTFIASLEADRDLAASVEILTLDDGDTGWLAVDNAWWRISTIPLALGFTDVEPITR